MKLACADFSWPGLSHTLVLDLIKELGCEGVLLGLIGDYSPIALETVRSDVPFWAGRLAERVEAHGLVFADVFPIGSMDLAQMAVNHPEAAERDAAAALFDEMLDLSDRLGVDGLTILPGMPFEQEPWETSFERACSELASRVEQAGARGLRLSVEPHHGSIVETVATTQRMVDAVPGLELTLDYGHFNVQGVTDDEIEPLLAHARILHLRPGREGLVQTRMADNSIDFGRMVDRLAELGFDGWLALEFVHDARPGCQECDVLQEAKILAALVRQRLDRRRVGSAA